MVQIITKPETISGRLGKGLGQGLAETVPKEVERSRLSYGLKKFEQESSNLTPIQQLARLSSIPGITPQMIESFGQLARQQSQRNAYGQGQQYPGYKNGSQVTQGLSRNVDNANLPQGNIPGNQQSKINQEKNIPSDYPNIETQSQDMPGVAKNPYSKELEPLEPLTQQERDEYIGFLLNRDPNLTLREAQEMTDKYQQNEMARRETQQKVESNRVENEKLLEDQFDKDLNTVLQAEGNEKYKDLSGEYITNLKKAMRNDLINNPNLNIKSASLKWVNKGKELANVKTDLNVIANRDILDKLNPNKKEENLKRLKSAEKIFRETGNNREYYNLLQGKDFGLTPGGAALIAYPRSDRIKNILNKNKSYAEMPVNKINDASRKFAVEVANNLTPNDSFLAIARQMKDVNPYFNENVFWDQLRSMQDEISINPRQKEEFLKGVSDLIPNWGDIMLFPRFGKSVTHD